MNQIIKFINILLGHTSYKEISIQHLNLLRKLIRKIKDKLIPITFREDVICVLKIAKKPLKISNKQHIRILVMQFIGLLLPFFTTTMEIIQMLLKTSSKQQH